MTLNSIQAHSGVDGCLSGYNGNIVAQKFISADGEWMTEDFVPFTGTLEFTAPAGNYSLILRNDNPSGETSMDKSVSIPVVIN